MKEINVQIPKEPTRIWDLYVPIVTKGKTTYVFLTSEIRDASFYDELVFRLLLADQDETFVIYLNNPGGNLDTAIYLLNALRNTLARTIAKLTAETSSAATIITMACDEIEVDDHVSFMLHTYSTEVNGKGSDIKIQQAFMEHSIAELMGDVYKNFLTEEEVQQLLEGKDFWFTKTQLKERWARKQGYTIE